MPAMSPVSASTTRRTATLARVLSLLLLSLLAVLPAPAQKDTGKQTKTARTIRHTRSTARKPVAPATQPITVWVNTKTGIYHYPGQRWYGTTKQGMYMSEKDAQAHGYRATLNGQ